MDSYHLFLPPGDRVETCNDFLDGGNGNDTLDGGEGIDTMLGGVGHDNYYIDNPLDIAIEDRLSGYDKIYTTVSFNLPDNFEKLVLMGDIGLIGRDNALDNELFGSKGNDLLIASAGKDTLNGSLGADTMQGGAGFDTYYVDNVLDVVIENPREGLDVIFTTVDYTLPDNVEKLVLTGDNLTGRGNEFNNTLIGSGQRQTFIGGDGEDLLVGKGGDDHYLFKMGDNKDTIRDYDPALGNHDVIQLQDGYTQENTILFKSKNQLWIGNTERISDLIMVEDHFLDDASAIEEIRLDDGSFLLKADIEQVISDMAGYAASNGIDLKQISNVRNNADMASIVSGAWQLE